MRDLNEVLDLTLNLPIGGKTYVVLPRPVLQRLLDGTTRGIALRPLGAINASFYASENAPAGAAPTLHFTTTAQ